MDCYAYAAWGLRTTRSAVKGAYRTEKTWVGAKDAPRTEFDPTTGKPNYKTTTTIPRELENAVLSVGYVENNDVVIPLSYVTPGSHRGRTVAVEAKSEPTPESVAAFRASMQALGLWDKGQWGHWVFLYVSV